MWVSYNFNLIKEQDLQISFTNRGFQYNDGFFDTLLIVQGKIRFLTDHLERIRRAMQVLGLNILTELAQAQKFENVILSLVNKNNLKGENIRVKINVWRKPGGLFTPESEDAEILLIVLPQPPFPTIIKHAGFYEEIPNRFTPLSFFKGPYALHYVQAGIAKKKAGWDEIIILDEKGHISETSVANIFWGRANQLFTPALETGCIAGIMRLNILRACQKLKVVVREGLYAKADLLAADFIFTSNVTGLRVAQEINGTTFATSHPLLTELQHLVLT